MIRRYRHTIGGQKSYPTCKSEYRELLAHPIDISPAYFQEATAASTLIPLLSVWATAMGETRAAGDLAELVGRKLSHSTLQLWTLDDLSDQHLWTNAESHGRAILDLPADGGDAIAMLEEVRRHFGDFAQVSAIRVRWEPMVLTACRHWRLPVPIEFYSWSLANSIAPQPSASTDDRAEAPVAGEGEGEGAGGA